MAYVSGYQGALNSGQQVKILSGQQESAEINCGGFTLCGIFVPSVFTSTALTFEAATASGGTYVPLKVTTSGTALSYTVAAGAYYAIDPKDFQGIQFLKIKSGSAEAADRILTCTLKGF